MFICSWVPGFFMMVGVGVYLWKVRVRLGSSKMKVKVALVGFLGVGRMKITMIFLMFGFGMTIQGGRRVVVWVWTVVGGSFYGLTYE